METTGSILKLKRIWRAFSHKKAERITCHLRIWKKVLLRMNLVQRNIEVPARGRKETLATVGAQEVYEGTSASEAGLHWRNKLAWLPTSVSRLDTVNTRRKSEAQHEARMREQQLHGWSIAKKEALIRGDIETLKQLSKKKDLSWACRRKIVVR